MRVFIAVWPSPAVVAAIATLPRVDAPAVRWLPEPNWHVTLRFLGDIDDAQLGQVTDRLADAVPAATAEAGPATVLLNRSVLAVPVRGLDALAAAMVDRTAGFGQPPDPRPFRGHITIARAVGRQRLSSALAGSPIDGRWNVAEITVVRSVLGSTGARYEIVARVPAR